MNVLWNLEVNFGIVIVEWWSVNVWLFLRGILVYNLNYWYLVFGVFVIKRLNLCEFFFWINRYLYVFVVCFREVLYLIEVFFGENIGEFC